ncbi:MAG: hypothetical protein IT281_04480 [Ignavibacteria bacterium]|nr:hypothetical protein [Ignavibacteria bacterium]
MKDVIVDKVGVECHLTTFINIIGGKIMLKHFLVVMLLFVLAVSGYSQSIPSGTGRYSALGNSPFILDAHVDMLNNPAWNNYYRNYAFADLTPEISNGNFDGHAGVTFGVGKKWNLGFIVNRRSDMYERLRDTNNLYPGNSSPIVPFMGLIGTSVNKNFHIGLAPYVAMWSNKTTSTDTTVGTFDASSSSLGANLGFMYMIKKGWIEGAFNFRMNKYKRTTTVGSSSTVAENDGGIQFGANFRGWIYPTKGSKVAIVPVLGFSTMSFTPKTTTGSTTVNGLKHSYMDISGGVGLNWPIMDDIQIAGGVTAYMNTFKADSGNVEFKSNALIAPVFHMAVESRIADWLTGRLGFKKGVNSSTQTTTSGTRTDENKGTSPNNSSSISLGAGFHFGRLSIDATVSERWFKHGLNFLSGGDIEDMFIDLSASYNFAK